MTNEKTSDNKVLLKIIGLLGIVAAGVFANWDKIFSKSGNPPISNVSTIIDLTSTTSSTPERSLRLYAQSLTNRGFDELTEIYPRRPDVAQRAWLKGEREELEITVVRVAETKRLPPSASGEVILRATMEYCQVNGTGSTYSQDYTFVQNQKLWQLEDLTKRKDPKPIKC